MAKDTLDLDISRALAQINSLDSSLGAAASHFSEGIARAISQLNSQSIVVDADTSSIAGEVSGAVDAADTTTTVEVDSSSLDAAADASDRLSFSLTDAKSAATALAAVFGGAAVAGFFKDSIDAASDLTESTNKARVVFRAGADDVIAFGESAAQSVGLASDQAIEAAASFGSLFLIAGTGEKQAAALSTELVVLAADLASVNNVPVDEALERLRSGLIGEAEPLRRLNVLLSEGAVAAKAVELGLASSTDSLSEGAKVQARYALIMEQTSRFQGDFARTSEDLANTQRILSAEFRQVQVEVGNELLPNVLALARAAGDDLLPTFEDLAVETARLGATALPLVANAGGAVLPILQVLSQLLSVIPADVAEGVLTFAALARVLPTVSTGVGAGVTAVAVLLPLLRDIDPEAADAATSIAFLAAAGYRFGGATGAAIGAAVGLVSALAATKSNAELAAEAIEEVAGASDRAVTQIAKQTATELARQRIGADAVTNERLANKERERTIEVLREMATEGDKGAGSAQRLGQAYVDAGVITEQQFNRVLRDTREAQAQVNETTDAGTKALEDNKTALQGVVDAAVSTLPTLGAVLSTTEQQLAGFGLGLDSAASPEQFLANLQASIVGVQEFNTNIALLVGRGLEDTAAALAQLGPEIGGAQAQAILDGSPLVAGAIDSNIKAQRKQLEDEADILKRILGPKFKAAFDQTSEEGRTGGKQMGAKYAAGLRSRIPDVEGAGKDVARAAIRGFNNAGSPSDHLFFDSGKAHGTAYGQGLSVAGAEVVAEAQRITRAAAGVNGTVGGLAVPSAAGGNADLVAALSAAIGGGNGGPQVIVVRDLWEAETIGAVPPGTTDRTAFLAGR